MIVRLDEIPPEGLRVETELDPRSPAIEFLGAEGPIRGEFRINRLGSQVLVRGLVAGRVQLECARCLKAFSVEIQEAVNVELRPASEMDGAEVELKPDDLDVEYFSRDTLDLDHMLVEQISLALPMKPLCSDGCRGLCSMCGKPLSGGKCSCVREEIDPRWGPLAALKKKLEEEG